MAIIFTGGTNGASGSSTSIVLTYSSTVGNTLILAVSCHLGAAYSISDSSGTNTWTKVNNSAVGSTNSLAYCVNAAAVTSITLSGLTGNFNFASLGEYSGIGGVRGSAVSLTSASSPSTVSTNMANANNFFIASICGNSSGGTSVWQVVTGNVVQQGSYFNVSFGSFPWGSALMDNTGSTFITTGGQLDCDSTNTNCFAVGLEFTQASSGGLVDPMGSMGFMCKGNNGLYIPEHLRQQRRPLLWA